MKEGDHFWEGTKGGDLEEVGTPKGGEGEAAKREE